LNESIGAVTGQDGPVGPVPGSSPSKLNRAQLNWLVKLIFKTRSEELSCGECYEVVDTFAELRLLGRDAAEAMPLVQDHLDRCPPCREEFEALLDALRAVSGSD
jgi:hypothetical protein